MKKLVLLIVLFPMLALAGVEHMEADAKTGITVFYSSQTISEQVQFKVTPDEKKTALTSEEKANVSNGKIDGIPVVTDNVTTRIWFKRDAAYILDLFKTLGKKSAEIELSRQLNEYCNGEVSWKVFLNDDGTVWYLQLR